MRYYFILFVLYEIIISFYFYKQYTNKVSDHHQSVLKLVEHSLDNSINTFGLANDDFHSQYSYEISKLVSLSNGASLQERNEIREKLLDSFMPFYINKKLYAFEGMHIFDKRGYSLLRFHEPDKYDDHIVNLRYSLQSMLKNFSYQKGFELGIFKESYRFQYPLFYDGDFVGSYEYSVSPKALMNEMKKFYANQYLLLFKFEQNNLLDRTENIKKHYSKAMIGTNEFYFQVPIHSEAFDELYFNYITKNKKTIKAINSKRASVVDYNYKGQNLAVAIKPIYDIENKYIAYMFIYVNNNYIINFRYEFFIAIILSSVFSLMLFIFIIKQVKHRLYVMELVNMQHDMLVVTDGEKIKDANNALLKFFGFETLKDFNKKHLCVCEFFIEEEGYLQQYNNGIIWTQYMIQNPDIKFKVKILDISNKNMKIFEVEYELFKDSHYTFILFRDVTDEVNIQNELLARANYDALTNIYNRDRFEHFLTIELEKSSKNNELFSLIMFDIDHFKLVNDNFGHDIGDTILKEITTLVSSHIRDTDTFARWGGEEFMIISKAEIQHSALFAEKLRSIIDEYRFSNVTDVTCSFGVTQFHKNDTLESIVKRCDDALYKAKNSGRNCVYSMS
jgi:diguanylate cyclase (GGDEF)-like protein